MKSSFLPVVAIVGRPNVGKSTFFNYLTCSRQALVVDTPGVTRDRLYGETVFNGRRAIVVDSGGIGSGDELMQQVEEQAWQAVQEADAIFFVVDARTGITTEDEKIARRLRQFSKPICVIVNKVDGLEVHVACSEFFKLGWKEIYPIVATQGRGVDAALQVVFPLLPQEIEVPSTLGIKIAVVGRPNAGKSTLINRIVGETRVLVSELPGTTRDSVYIPLKYQGNDYILIDTAGVRRKRAVTETIEKFSVIKTLQAIAESDVVILVIDAKEGIAEQDLRLLGFVLDEGKALVVAINKWESLSKEEKVRCQSELDRRLTFVDFARQHFISAKEGMGIGKLFTSVQEAYQSTSSDLSTSEITRVLQAAVAAHQPPAPGGRLIKLRYAHLGGRNPPTIIIHGKQTDSIPESYRRYLANFFRESLKLFGTPIMIIFKNDHNPYVEKSE